MRKLRKSELVCESDKIKRNLFDDIIEKKIRRSVSYPDNPIPERYIPHKDNSEEDPPSSPDDANPVDSDVSATFKKPITDHIIRFEVILPWGDKIKGAKAIGSTNDANYSTVEKYNDTNLVCIMKAK